jgi:hypothetical protein
MNNSSKNEWIRLLKNLAISYLFYAISISFGIAKNWIQGLISVFLAWSVIYIFQMFIESTKEEAIKEYQKKQWEENPQAFSESQLRILKKETEKRMREK